MTAARQTGRGTCDGCGARYGYEQTSCAYCRGPVPYLVHKTQSVGKTDATNFSAFRLGLARLAARPGEIIALAPGVEYRPWTPPDTGDWPL